MIKPLPNTLSISRFLKWRFGFLLIPLLFFALAGKAQIQYTGSLLDDFGAALGDPKSVYVSGNYAFVVSDWNPGGCIAGTEQTIEIIDISNPAAPVHKGYIANTWGGALLYGANSIFVVGNYAYVTTGTPDPLTLEPCYTGPNNALEIIDISNPSKPVHKSSILNGAGGAILSNPQSIYVSGGYAYIANYDNNTIEVIDVNDPANPTHKSNFAGGNKTGALLYGPKSIFVSGNYAYVASLVSNALEIIDVTNPAALKHVSWIDGEAGAALSSPSSVYVLNSYAYVTSTNSLEIINVSNPLLPVHVAKLSIGGANSVSVLGNVATVTTGASNSLVLVDVTNPSAPSVAATVTNGTGGARLAKPNSVFNARINSTNYAFVSAQTSEALEIVNITTPSAPVHTGSISWKNGAINKYGTETVAVSGNYAYLATSYYSLQIVNVGNPNQPVAMGSLTDGAGGATLTYLETVFVSGNYAYLAGSSNYLEIADVTNPSSPVHKGKVDVGFGYKRSLKVVGNNAYISSANIFKIVNVANPSAPTVFPGSLTFGTTPQQPINSIYVSGSIAYVGYQGTLYLINVSNSSAPVIKGSIAGMTGCISVVGNTAYVNNINGGLSIYDVTNPAAPVLKSTISGVSPFALAGNYAYCYVPNNSDTGGFTLKIFNISNPAAPLLVGSMLDTQLPDYGFKFINSSAVSGNYVYVASSQSTAPNLRGGLEILQFSPLSITSFSPGSGIAGTTVTITGTGFSTTPANNIVTFNGVAATVTASTATTITVTVPSGATTGPIQVSRTDSSQPSVSSTSNFLVGYQSIPFGPIPLQCGPGTLTLPATATSGLTVTYTSSDLTVATVSGNILTIKGFGSCIITASQSGDGTWLPAATVKRTLTVTSSLNMFASNGSDICTSGATTLSTNAPLNATFLWSDNSTGATLDVSSIGTYSVTASWSGCSASGSIDVTADACGGGTISCPHPPCQIARIASQSTATAKDGDLPNVKELTAYPNPSSDKITIASPFVVTQDTPVVLYNMVGEALIKATMKAGQWKTDLHVSQLNEGLYVVHVGNGDNVNSVKVMLVRK